MVERGKGPEFPVEEPNKHETAPNFSADGSSSSLEEEPTAPNPVILEKMPESLTPPIPAVETKTLDSSEVNDVVSINGSEDTLTVQTQMEGVFEAGAKNDV